MGKKSRAKSKKNAAAAKREATLKPSGSAGSTTEVKVVSKTAPASISTIAATSKTPQLESASTSTVGTPQDVALLVATKTASANVRPASTSSAVAPVVEVLTIIPKLSDTGKVTQGVQTAPKVASGPELNYENNVQRQDPDKATDIAPKQASNPSPKYEKHTHVRDKSNLSLPLSQNISSNPSQIYESDIQIQKKSMKAQPASNEVLVLGSAKIYEKDGHMQVMDKATQVGSKKPSFAIKKDPQDGDLQEKSTSYQEASKKEWDSAQKCDKDTHIQDTVNASQAFLQTVSDPTKKHHSGLSNPPDSQDTKEASDSNHPVVHSQVPSLLNEHRVLEATNPLKIVESMTFPRSDSQDTIQISDSTYLVDPTALSYLPNTQAVSSTGNIQAITSVLTSSFQHHDDLVTHTINPSSSLLSSSNQQQEPVPSTTIHKHIDKSVSKQGLRHNAVQNNENYNVKLEVVVNERLDGDDRKKINHAVMITASAQKIDQEQHRVLDKEDIEYDELDEFDLMLERSSDISAWWCISGGQNKRTQNLEQDNHTPQQRDQQQQQIQKLASQHVDQKTQQLAPQHDEQQVLQQPEARQQVQQQSQELAGQQDNQQQVHQPLDSSKAVSLQDLAFRSDNPDAVSHQAQDDAHQPQDCSRADTLQTSVFESDTISQQTQNDSQQLLDSSKAASLQEPVLQPENTNYVSQQAHDDVQESLDSLKAVSLQNSGFQLNHIDTISQEAQYDSQLPLDSPRAFISPVHTTSNLTNSSLNVEMPEIGPTQSLDPKAPIPIESLETSTKRGHVEKLSSETYVDSHQNQSPDFQYQSLPLQMSSQLSPSVSFNHPQSINNDQKALAHDHNSQDSESETRQRQSDHESEVIANIDVQLQQPVGESSAEPSSVGISNTPFSANKSLLSDIDDTDNMTATLSEAPEISKTTEQVSVVEGDSVRISIHLESLELENKNDRILDAEAEDMLSNELKIAKQENSPQSETFRAQKEQVIYLVEDVVCKDSTRSEINSVNTKFMRSNEFIETIRVDTSTSAVAATNLTSNDSTTLEKEKQVEIKVSDSPFQIESLTSIETDEQLLAETKPSESVQKEETTSVEFMQQHDQKQSDKQVIITSEEHIVSETRDVEERKAVEMKSQETPNRIQLPEPVEIKENIELRTSEAAKEPLSQIYSSETETTEKNLDLVVAKIDRVADAGFGVKEEKNVATHVKLGQGAESDAVNGVTDLDAKTSSIFERVSKISGRKPVQKRESVNLLDQNISSEISRESNQINVISGGPEETLDILIPPISDFKFEKGTTQFMQAGSQLPDPKDLELVTKENVLYEQPHKPFEPSISSTVSVLPQGHHTTEKERPNEEKELVEDNSVQNTEIQENLFSQKDRARTDEIRSMPGNFDLETSSLSTIKTSDISHSVKEGMKDIGTQDETSVTTEKDMYPESRSPVSASKLGLTDKSQQNSISSTQLSTTTSSSPSISASPGLKELDSRALDCMEIDDEALSIEDIASSSSDEEHFQIHYKYEGPKFGQTFYDSSDSVFINEHKITKYLVEIENLKRNNFRIDGELFQPFKEPENSTETFPLAEDEIHRCSDNNVDDSDLQVDINSLVNDREFSLSLMEHSRLEVENDKVALESFLESNAKQYYALKSMLDHAYSLQQQLDEAQFTLDSASDTEECLKSVSDACKLYEDQYAMQISQLSVTEEELISFLSEISSQKNKLNADLMSLEDKVVAMEIEKQALDDLYAQLETTVLEMHQVLVEFEKLRSKKFEIRDTGQWRAKTLHQNVSLELEKVEESSRNDIEIKMSLFDGETVEDWNECDIESLKTTGADFSVEEFALDDLQIGLETKDTVIIDIIYEIAQCCCKKFGEKEGKVLTQELMQWLVEQNTDLDVIELLSNLKRVSQILNPIEWPLIYAVILQKILDFSKTKHRRKHAEGWSYNPWCCIDYSELINVSSKSHAVIFDEIRESGFKNIIIQGDFLTFGSIPFAEPNDSNFKVSAYMFHDIMRYAIDRGFNVILDMPLPKISVSHPWTNYSSDCAQKWFIDRSSFEYVTESEYSNGRKFVTYYDGFGSFYELPCSISEYGAHDLVELDFDGKKFKALGRNGGSHLALNFGCSTVISALLQGIGDLCLKLQCSGIRIKDLTEWYPKTNVHYDSVGVEAQTLIELISIFLAHISEDILIVPDRKYNLKFDQKIWSLFSSPEETKMKLYNLLSECDVSLLQNESHQIIPRLFPLEHGQGLDSGLSSIMSSASAAKKSGGVSVNVISSTSEKMSCEENIRMIYCVAVYMTSCIPCHYGFGSYFIRDVKPYRSNLEAKSSTGKGSIEKDSTRKEVNNGTDGEEKPIFVTQIRKLNELREKGVHNLATNILENHVHLGTAIILRHHETVRQKYLMAFNFSKDRKVIKLNLRNHLKTIGTPISNFFVECKIDSLAGTNLTLNEDGMDFSLPPYGFSILEIIPNQFTEKEILRSHSDKLSLYLSPKIDIFQKVYPVLVKWTDPGKEPKAIGTFTEWKKSLNLMKSSTGNKHYGIVCLPADDYEMKFIVDDEWKCSKNYIKKSRAGQAADAANNILKVKDAYDVGLLNRTLSAITTAENKLPPVSDKSLNVMQPVLIRWTSTSTSSEIDLVGFFDNLPRMYPMMQSLEEGNTVWMMTYASRGKHYYKFIVDGVWTVSPEYPSEIDDFGFLSNYVVV